MRTIRASSMVRAGASALALLLLQVSSASAQGTPYKTSLGDTIANAMDDMVGPLLFVITLLCALGGIFLFVKGLMKLKDAHQGQGEMKTAFVCIFAATLLVALPEASGMGMMSMMGTSNIFFSSSELKVTSDALDGNAAAGMAPSLSAKIKGLARIGNVDDCSAGTGGVPCMARNLALNVVPAAIIAAFAFVYVAGLWGFGSALFELARHAGERGGGVPPGFWTKAIASILMLAAPPFLMAVSKSVIGSEGPVGMGGLNAGSPLLTYSLGGAGVLQQYSQLIGYIFQILALFGVLAFAKGLFVLKGAGEQRQNATYSNGIVFMVAGVLLANAKLSTCTILGTITGFGTASTIGFCS